MNTKLTKTALRKMDRAQLVKLGTEHCLLEHLDTSEVDALTKTALIDEIGGALLRIEVGEEYTAMATDQVARPVDELIGYTAPSVAVRRTRSAKRADAALARVQPIIDAAAAAAVAVETAAKPRKERREYGRHPEGTAAVEQHKCPTCGAAKGKLCIRHDGETTPYVHGTRLAAFDKKAGK